MLHENAPDHSEKIRLFRELHRLSEAMRERSGLNDVTLDSYIISETPYETLRTRWIGSWTRSDFAQEHILFSERNCDYDYLKTLMTTGLNIE